MFLTNTLTCYASFFSGSAPRPSLLYGFCFAVQTSEDFVTICYVCHLAYRSSSLVTTSTCSCVFCYGPEERCRRECYHRERYSSWRVLEQRNSECRSLWEFYFSRDHHVLGCAMTGLTCCTAPNPACRTRPTVSRSGMQIADPSYIS